MSETSFLRTISDVGRIITPIDTAVRFPEIVDLLVEKYGNAIDVFCQLIIDSSSSADVLRKIRSPDRDAAERMALLKMYRRCVAPVLDIETIKKSAFRQSGWKVKSNQSPRFHCCRYRSDDYLKQRCTVNSSYRFSISRGSACTCFLPFT